MLILLILIIIVTDIMPIGAGILWALWFIILLLGGPIQYFWIELFKAFRD